jgi:alkylated DNA repair dioxygenase AlkB
LIASDISQGILGVLVMHKEIILPVESAGSLFEPVVDDGSIVDLWHGVFTKQQAKQLMTDLDQSVSWRQDHIIFFGKSVPLPRLTAWFGDPGFNYMYSGIQMAPTPWSPPLLEIKAEVERICKLRFNSVLLNKYRDGNDKVSWHSDDEPELGPAPCIASVSLGATRVFKLRPKPHKNGNKSTSLDLSSGSVLVMAGTTQKYWEHELARTAKLVGPRINLTFRHIMMS